MCTVPLGKLFGFIRFGEFLAERAVTVEGPHPPVFNFVQFAFNG